VERDVKRKLKKHREGNRKRDILYKVASLVEDLARKNKAVVVVGDIGGDDKERMSRNKGGRLRYRIHRWSVSKPRKLLENRPIHVVRVSEGVLKCGSILDKEDRWLQPPSDPHCGEGS
jgi:IS605 OrfB family transposase